MYFRIHSQTTSSIIASSVSSVGENHLRQQIEILHYFHLFLSQCRAQNHLFQPLSLNHRFGFVKCKKKSQNSTKFNQNSRRLPNGAKCGYTVVASPYYRSERLDNATGEAWGPNPRQVAGSLKCHFAFVKKKKEKKKTKKSISEPKTILNR